MSFLQNTGIMPTLALLVFAGAVFIRIGQGGVQRSNLVALLGTLLLFFVLHRYGSRTGSASAALQVTLLVVVMLPGLIGSLPVRPIAADVVAERIVAGVVACVWIVAGGLEFFSVKLPALFWGNRHLFFFVTILALVVTALLSRDKDELVSGALWLSFAVLNVLGMGGLAGGGPPASPGLVVWVACLLALAVAGGFHGSVTGPGLLRRAVRTAPVVAYCTWLAVLVGAFWVFLVVGLATTALLVWLGRRVPGQTT